MKICIECKLTKPYSDFHRQNKKLDYRYHSIKPEDHGKSYGDGYHSRCKPCRKEKRKQWETPDKSKKYSLKRLYGLSVEDFDEMRKDQNYRCAICGKHESKNRCGVLYVDHCHETGKVRKLLCLSCNNVLGLVEENEETLKAMLEYISTTKNGF